ncbi:hypothetical protein ACHQM5_007006 [Ranunculus cassubicifolius]
MAKLSTSLAIALLCFLFGTISFILGVIAENKKPASGIAFGKDVVTCKFPNDPTVALGSISVVSLLISAIIGITSVFYSYEGKSVPTGVLFESTSLVVFFIIAILVTVAGGAMMLWVTITEALHHVHNTNHVAGYECPTAKTGLFGGAAFLCFCSMLFWLICQMLTHNSREDHLGVNDPKGEYGEVLATDYESKPGKV